MTDRIEEMLPDTLFLHAAYQALHQSILLRAARCNEFLLQAIGPEQGHPEIDTSEIRGHLGETVRCRVKEMLNGLLGLIGGMSAATPASVSGYLIVVELFGLPGRFSAAIWWLGIGAGTLVVMLVGWLATRRLLGAPPLKVLNSG